MRVFMTGATGFLGRAVSGRLLRDGHEVTAWVRSPDRARAVLASEVKLVPTRGGAAALAGAVSNADAVINLAGEPLIGKRWTAARRRALEDSRIQLTRDLVAAIAAASAASRPGVLISASGVGWYGDRGDERLTERSTPGDDYTAQLCRRWEDAAAAASACDVRVVVSRTSIVLGHGGALAPMLPPFRLGLGGPIGSGRQFFPWVHIDDFVDAITSALVDDRYRGPVNVVAPQQVTNREFAGALGRALHRPAIMPVPAFALRVLFGEAATVLLGSQRAEPAVLRERGFQFAFTDLDSALTAILRPAPRRG